MKSYCLKCRKDTENVNPSASNTSNGRTLSKLVTVEYYQNVQHVVVENQDLVKIKKQKDY